MSSGAESFASPSSGLAVVILAAGRGTRMRSRLPKVMHRLASVPMVRHVLRAAEALEPARVIVVTAPGMEDVAAAVAPHEVAVQTQARGTGDAVLAAQEALTGHEGAVLVLFGDSPLVTAETLRPLLTARASGAALVLLGMRPADPSRYGRIVTDEAGHVRAIVEWKDASEVERAITLCNAGMMLVERETLFSLLGEVGTANAAGECYLTDIVALARGRDLPCSVVVGEEDDLRGVNSRSELAAAEAVIQRRLREAAMDGGVTLVRPETVQLAADTHFGEDVVVEPYVMFGPGVSVESGAVIRAFSHLEGAEVGAGALVGPYARLRPGAVLKEDVHVGNFVEVKAATLEQGAKANHLTYIGDADIGAGSNIGAGTITCNYDGFAKHRTRIGAGVFIGSNTALVAPVSLGDGAMTAAGSTISRDVPANALAIERASQDVREGWAAKFRERKTKRKG